MKEADIKNMEAYARKMLLDGFIIKKDYTLMRKAITEIHRLGVNVNQIAHVANSMQDVRLSEIRSIQKGVNEILQLLLSKG